MRRGCSRASWSSRSTQKNDARFHCDRALDCSLNICPFSSPDSDPPHTERVLLQLAAASIFSRSIVAHAQIKLAFVHALRMRPSATFKKIRRRKKCICKHVGNRSTKPQETTMARLSRMHPRLGSLLVAAIVVVVARSHLCVLRVAVADVAVVAAARIVIDALHAPRR